MAAVAAAMTVEFALLYLAELAEPERAPASRRNHSRTILGGGMGLSPVQFLLAGASLPLAMADASRRTRRLNLRRKSKEKRGKN